MSMFNDHRGQQDHNIDSAIAQALNSFEAGPMQQQQQQQSQQQEKQHRSSDLSDAHLHHHHHHQIHDHHLPIDPSIADSDHAGSINDKDTQELIRNTAQAAVNSRSKLDIIRTVTRSGSGSGGGNGAVGNGNKITKPRVNKPGQKFGAKKKSWVWNWFSQDPVDCNLATCDTCGKVIKRLASDKGSPKKLGEHLKTHKIHRESTSNDRHAFVITTSSGPAPTTVSTSSNSTDQSNNDATTRHYYNTITASQYKQHPLSNSTTANESQVYNGTAQSSTTNTSNENTNNQSSTQTSTGFDHLQFDKSEFDQSPYSQSKFQKDLMKFLVDNRLPLTIVKSPSFRQVIFTLKPEAIPDLNELNHLYTSLLDVIHSEREHLSVEEVPEIHDDHDQETAERNQTVDSALGAASAAGWV